MAGAAWALAMRWSIKILGFASTAIMARLLAPADYGIVAMAMLVVGLMQTLLDFGAATALIRKDQVTRDDIDSAWTLRVIEGVAMAVLLLLASVPAGLYFKEPRVPTVLWVLAASIAFASVGNIGITLAIKALNFSLEYRYAVTCKVIAVIVTIACGVLLHDYRALAIGISTGYVCGCVFSYLMHPYRPRWNTSKIGEIWRVTKWLMFAGIATFILRKGDELIAARIGSTAEYGMYNVGADLGQMPTGEIAPAILRALLPVLSSIQGEAERTNQAVIKTLAAVNTLTFGIGAGMFALAPAATALVLGPKWAGAAVFVALFAAVGSLQIMTSPLQTLLTLRGHTKVQSLAVWIEFGVLIGAAGLLAPHFGLVGLAYARGAGAIGNFLFISSLARRLCRLPLRAVAAATLRPLLGAICMVPIIELTCGMFEIVGVRVAIALASGAAFYIGWCVITWHLFGRPEGLESTLFDKIRARQLV